MVDFPLLTAILLTPIWGILVLSVMPREADKTIKMISAVTMAIALGLTLYAYWAYDVSSVIQGTFSIYCSPPKLTS